LLRNLQQNSSPAVFGNPSISVIVAFGNSFLIARVAFRMFKSIGVELRTTEAFVKTV
jgi:hypothetical protein